VLAEDGTIVVGDRNGSIAILEVLHNDQTEANRFKPLENL